MNAWYFSDKTKLVSILLTAVMSISVSVKALSNFSRGHGIEKVISSNMVMVEESTTLQDLS